MEKPNFQRKIENFSCLNCGNKIKGNGYTNHCPRCLYSRHVDINPGDRSSHCKGMMKPISIEKDKDAYNIIHKCLKCHVTKSNIASADDDFEKILEIAQQFHKA